MNFSKKILSQTVTRLCLVKGIDRIVISPGSRNAPLTIGFTENAAFKNFSVVDERSAAFFALGMAQQLDGPVALVCTSGSALLNYYPAIAEAYYSDIPLVILSADRPAHLVEIGDGQTIKQENVYSNHILYSANCKEGSHFQAWNEEEINKALNRAITLKGPVHINLPFSEPLYETTTVPMAESRIIEPQEVIYENFRAGASAMAYDQFLSEWNKAGKKMILVGVLAPNSIEQRLIDILAEDESTLILTETTSNLHHKKLFPAIDQLIAPLDEVGLNKLKPEILLTFGGMVVSKKVKAFLRNFEPQKHYHVNPKKAYNTFFKLTHHFKTDANTFLKYLVADIKQIKVGYQSYWLNIKKHRLSQHKRYVASIPFSDFKVFYLLFQSLPKNIVLQLANSATVRYAQLFDLHKSFHVFCNRGTSGIDGSTSTAIGAALETILPTVFITGDLSFFYDSNALWNNYVKSSFRVIIVNNGGGGIFRILPGKKNTENFSAFFETKHQLTAVELAKMHGFGYQYAMDESSFKTAVDSFFKISETPKILEIFTPFSVNDKILLDYFDFIR